MFAQNQKISRFQFQILLFFYFLNTTFLFLPAEFAKLGGSGGIFFIGFWGLITLFVVFLLTHLGKQIPEYTVVEWYGYCFGGTLGKIFSTILAIILIFFASMELRIFSEMIIGYMLPKTPLALIITLFVGLSAYGALGGMESAGRLAELFVYFVLIPFLIILACVTLSTDFSRIIWTTPDLENTWQAGVFFAPIFQGLTLILFIFPYLQHDKGKKLMIGVPFILFLFLLALVLSLGLAIFGENLLAEKLYPTLQILERVSFQGIFLSRQDVFFIWFWFASIFLYVSGMLFFSSTIFVRLSSKVEKISKKYLYIMSIILFLFAYLPKDLSTVYDIRYFYVPWFNGIIFVILPLLMLLIHTIKRGKIS